MQRLFLIFHGRFPSDKAASLFAAKNAEAFGKEGVEVTLVVPRLVGRVKRDPYAYYGVSKNFKLAYLPVLDIGTGSFLRRTRFFLSFLSFSLISFFYLVFAATRNDIIYSNESLPLYFASFLFPKTFYEMHDFPESKLWFLGVFLRRMHFVLVHNKWKLERLRQLFVLDEKKIIFIPNAVDIDQFNLALSMEEARQKLSLPLDKKIAVYTGHLYDWKGVGTLAKAAALLPADYLVIFVGGTEEDRERFSHAHASVPRIILAGFKPHKEIPLWQSAADVLVLPNTAKENISAYYTSPMKLFEYMASRRPIVASRLPSIIEIIDEGSAYLVAPDDPTALADGIKRAVTNRSEGESRIARAYSRVREHTWQKRAEKILRALQ